MIDENSSVTSKKWRKLNFTNLSQAGDDCGSFDFEGEFEKIINSAQQPKIKQETHYVNRVRMMRLKDSENFYTLASATVVACFSCNYSNMDRYHAISTCLRKVRRAVDLNSPNEMIALEKLERLADSIIDIFDC